MYYYCKKAVMHLKYALNTYLEKIACIYKHLQAIAYIYNICIYLQLVTYIYTDLYSTPRL